MGASDLCDAAPRPRFEAKRPRRRVWAHSLQSEDWNSSDTRSDDSEHVMADLPSGTVTFLFTDIEGSTRKWQAHPSAMAAAVARHDALLEAEMARHGGAVFKTVGDAFCVAFSRPDHALSAALAAQVALHRVGWGDVGGLRVRMALHAGAADERDGDYFGPPVNRIARLLSTAHGGQILVSQAVEQLVRDALPDGVTLRDLGQHRLKDLERPEHVFQLLAPRLAADFPPIRSLDARPTNLPAQLTPFIGREHQLRDVIGLLRHDRTRLVTLTGPGGIGKTRLGLQIAAELSDDFANGVWWVPLANVTNPGAVGSAIGVALDVQENGAEPFVTTLGHHIKQKRLLLVLDNFEHVLEAAPVVAALLGACPGLRVLATSREALMITGEQIYAVPTMELPPPAKQTVSDLEQYEGVQLFLARARDKKHDFALTAANAVAIVEICRLADGLPLGIELAAARVGYFPSLHELQARLAKRLPELKRRAPDLPPRLQTMRASIAWSYDLLNLADRTLFRRLAIFSGGFTLEAAEAVSASIEAQTVEVMEGLESLVDKSLVQAEESPSGARYRMLETIGEYGVEQLAVSGEEAHVRAAHARYYSALVEQAGPGLSRDPEPSWLDRLEIEHANLGAALEWSLNQSDPALSLRLASNLRPFWQIRGFLRDGYQWLERALARGQSAPPTARAAVLFDLGRLAFDLGDYARAPGYFETSLTLRRELHDKPGVVESLTNLGMAVAARGQAARARALHQEALEISRELGDPRGVASSLYRLGDLALEEGELAGARSLYRESLDMSGQQEDSLFVANLHFMLGVAARLEGDGLAAIESIGRGLVLFHRVGNRMGIANAHLELGHANRLVGKDEQAERHYAEALGLFREMGSGPGIVEGIEGLALIAAAHGRLARAAVLVGAASTWRKKLEHPFAPPADRFVQEQLVQETQQVHMEAFSKGQAMSLEQAAVQARADLTFP
jgi:predicted ATPase/class 3 adenylate cyclase